MRVFIGVTALLAAAGLVSAAPVAGPSAAAVATASATAVMAGEDCVPIDGLPLPASCTVSLEPTTLPQRSVIGEFEAGLLTRSAGTPTTAVADFAAGGVEGSCDPATEVCSLSDRLGLLDDPYEDTEQPPVTVPDDSTGSPDGDAAIVATDLDGDGRQEVVRANRCAGTTELCLSMFTPGARAPGAARHTAPQPTGLRVDGSGVGRIRLASGPVALAATSITGASFAVDDRQETTTATFTTDGPHGFAAGDPVRLGNDATLQQSLCVESPLARGGEQCIGGDLLSYRPITAVTRTTFSVDLGVLVVAERGVGHPVVPKAWSAACSDCGVRAESLGTGLVVAWVAPTASLQVATLTAVPTRAAPFRLIDTRPVGRLFQGEDADVPTTEAVDLVVDDFRPGGPHEIAVAWAGTCADAGRSCPRLSFLAMDDAARLTLRGEPDWGTQAWCTAEGEAGAAPTGWSTTAVSLSSGDFRGGASGTGLAVAWTALTPGERSDHLLQTFDVGSRFTLEPHVPLDPTDPDADPEPCATVVAHRDDPSASAGRSRILVEAENLDGRAGDELVVAETLPDAGGPTAPVALSVWSNSPQGEEGPGWRAQSRRQPEIGPWEQPFPSAGAVSTPERGYQAVGAAGSGQISLSVGRLARRQSDQTVDVAYPWAVNPDVQVGWTCHDQHTCGDLGSSADAAVAIDAVGVEADDAGTLRFAHEGGRTAAVHAADTPPGDVYSPVDSERSYLAMVTADLDGDSSTLGDPVTSYAVGEVQPMMVLRAPPVAFLPIDGSHPGYDKDGWMSSAEVYDLSNCYAGNGADTDTGDCPMRTSYLTEGGTETSMAVSVQNSWGVDTSAKAGLGGGTHDPGGDCKSVCWEATLELSFAHSEEQQTDRQTTRTFRYTTEQSAAPMQDRAFVATSDIEINQVPVYYGTFAGGALPDEPDLWTYSATPLDTVFSWISVNDPQYGSTFAGPTPGNPLSYPNAGSQIDTHREPVVSVRREGPTRLVVRTRSNHGYLCALRDGQVTTAFPSAVDAQCAGQQEPVRLRGAGAFDGTDYVVAVIRGPDEVVLQRIGAQVPVGSDPCKDGGCTLGRLPSELPVQTQEIGPGSSGSVSFEFGSVAGYQDRYAVSNGGSAEIATEGEVDTGPVSFLWEAHVKGEYARNDESMMSMVLESATTWGFDYGSASRPGSYRVTPYLADDPASGALTLTWTASPVGSSGLWGNPVWGYGAVGDPDLPARPDAAFSLPLLAEPYRVHSGLDDNLDVLMASPSFATWTCDDAGVCTPPDAQPVGRPLQISATVHNYALTDLPASPSRPLLVRFYLGDPARGGYAIAESRVTEPISRRGETVVGTRWTPPAGFVGQPGQPIYAVIDPNGEFEEVFDWETPVVLVDRELSGTVTRAASITVDGEPAFRFTTATDHGLTRGDPVTVRRARGYRVTDEPVLESTPTTFTVAASAAVPTRTGVGTWLSDQSSSCSSNNPWYGNATLDYYNFGDAEEFQSRCPTTNNEGYFLTPRFEGSRGGTPRSDLSVSDSDITLSKDRKSVVVPIGSSSRLFGEEVTARVWICARRSQTCSPQLAAPADRFERTGRLTVAAGGSARFRVPIGRSRLGKGSYRVAVQVFGRTVWERPAGPGYHRAAMGTMEDNQTVAQLRVKRARKP